MAIEGNPEVITRKKVDRTWRVECFCDAKTPVMDRTVVWHRATAAYDDKGNLDGDELPGGSVSRSFSQIAEDIIEAAGVKVSCAQIMALISAAGDKYRVEDLERAKTDASV